MNNPEFITATRKLEQYFDKDYTDEQLKIMFEELNELTLTRYNQIIANIIRTNKFLPKIVDFLEVHKQLPKYSESEQTEKCSRCQGSGIIVYKQLIKQGNEKIFYQFGARCTCKNAEKLSKKIPSVLEINI